MEVIGKRCNLLRPIRCPDGKVRFKEETPTIVRVVKNLDREMYLVSFTDRTTVMLFPTEVQVLDDGEGNTNNEEVKVQTGE